MIEIIEDSYDGFPPQMFYDALDKKIITNLIIQKTNTTNPIQILRTSCEPCRYVAMFDLAPDFILKAIKRELKEQE